MSMTTIKTVKTETVVVKFRKCDTCNAAAKFNVAFSFGELDFCLHHFNQHRIAIEGASVLIKKVGVHNEA